MDRGTQELSAGEPCCFACRTLDGMRTGSINVVVTEWENRCALLLIALVHFSSQLVNSYVSPLCPRKGVFLVGLLVQAKYFLEQTKGGN